MDSPTIPESSVQEMMDSMREDMTTEEMKNSLQAVLEKNVQKKGGCHV